jgi:Na+/melibiose symporter-like transporter
MTTSSSSPANDSSEGLSGSPPAHTRAERLSGRAWGMLVVLFGALFLGGFDVFGAVAVTAAMLLLVFTVVEAPDVGWGAPRTLASLAGVGALLAAFVAIERRAAAPLVRLGILRAGPLVRANLGAMALFGGCVGVLFIATLYMQQLRGWSALETGLAVFPAGVVVVALAPRIPLLLERFGASRVILGGLLSHVAAYSLFLSIGVDSSYLTVLLPTFLLVGLGFGLAYGPLNIAATNGVAPEEQGLASGLVTSSFKFGGALVLAVVTAVNEANAGPCGSAHALLDGFHAATVVSLLAGLLGAAAIAVSIRARGGPAAEPAYADERGRR